MSMRMDSGWIIELAAFLAICIICGVNAFLLLANWGARGRERQLDYQYHFAI